MEIKNYYASKKGKITKVLNAYILNDKLHQAILLDAPWGAGKTWYLKNDFIRSFTKKKENNNWQFVYISLFGLFTISELENKINQELLNGTINAYSKKYLKRKIPTKIYNVSSFVLNAILKYAGNLDTLDYTKLIEFLPNNNNIVYIFDDMERTKIDIIELLGFVNNLCEHNGSRVILVANEEQIFLRYKECKKPLDHANLEDHNNHDNNENKRLMSPYDKAKEKAISLTIKFQMNPDEAFQIILNSMVTDKKVQNLILGQEDFIIDLFIQKMDRVSGPIKNNNLLNLRILSFIDVITNDLFQEVFRCLVDIQQDEKWNINESELNYIKSDLFQELLRYIAVACFNFKLGNPLKHESFSYFNKNNQIIYFRNQYSFINSFVTCRTLNYQEMKQNLRAVINEYILLNKRKHSSLAKLYKWEYLGDNEVVQLLNQLKKEIFPITLDAGYIRSVIVLILQLKAVGFEVNIKSYISAILNALKSAETLPLSFRKNALYIDNYGVSDENLLNDYNREMAPVYHWFDQQTLAKTNKEYKFLIKNEWDENFSFQCVEHKLSFMENKMFLGFIDIPSAINKLEQSQPSEISYFFAGISKIYNFANINEFFKDDLPVIKDLLVNIIRIVESLDKKPNFKVKKANLIKLCNYLKYVESNLS